MRSTMILALALTISTASGATCINPVFDPTTQSKFGSVSWQGSIKLSLTESTPFPAGGKICTAFAGEDSCCDSTMLSAISLANNAVSASLVVSEKAWEAVDYTSMTSALNLVCLAAGIFSGKGDTCQADVKAGQDAFKASLDLVVQENLKCAKGMQAYGLGMACFACKADAVKYVDSTKEVVKLAQNTCNSVFATCGGVFTSYTNLVKQTIALVNRIVAQFSIKFDLNWDTDLCKGVGCQDYVCNTLLNGVASQLPQVQMPTKRRLDVTVDGDVRAEHVPLVESVMAHLASLEAAIAATADAAKGSHQRPTHRALAAATNEALAAENLNQVAPASVVSRVLATSSHSSYQSSGGYDPYAVGCKDIECPDISGTTTIIVVVAAVAVVALIVLVTMFAVRRRKGSAAGSPAGSEVVV